MSFDDLRAKYAGLIASQQHGVDAFSTVHAALLHLGEPTANRVASLTMHGRFWFSVRDAYHAPIFRVQRFET